MRVQLPSSQFLIFVALTATFALSACAANPYPTYRRERVDGDERYTYYSYYKPTERYSPAEPYRATEPYSLDEQYSPYERYTPAERRLRDESSVGGRSAMQGCLAGAAGVALITALITRDSRKTALGGAAGCVAGVGVNAYVQQERAGYLQREQRIQAALADLRRDNDRLASMIDNSKEVMAADRRKIAAIDAAYRSKAISAAEARERMRRIEANRDQVRSHLVAVREKENYWTDIAEENARGGLASAQIDAEIDKFKRQRAALEREYRLQQELINASPVAG